MSRSGSGRPRVGFIVGPTGAGKSALALGLAERLGAEIVNADSRQVYRGMDIGTAKPTRAERRRVAHHLIDIRTPAEPLDVADFARLARSSISEIAARGRAILVVGGSGLYLRAIRGGICAVPPASHELRQQLGAMAEQYGVPAMHRRLSEVDPALAARLAHNDLRRIIRGLEVFALTRIPLSEHQQHHRFTERDFDVLTVGITLPRPQLYEAVNQRFAAMVEAGLVDEIRALLAAGYDPGAPPLSTIGYSEIAGFVNGELTIGDAILRAQRESRRLAKRQLTWFGADPEIVWLDANHAAEPAFALFREFFQQESQDNNPAQQKRGLEAS
jgi:tRNA dimethylallyltransferase